MSNNKGTFETWTEDMTVAGSELMETLKEMMNDASIHRMRVINNRTEKTVVDIPAAAAIPVALMLNVWALIGAAVLYAADFRVIVERLGAHPDSAESAADNVAEEIVILDEEPEAEAPAEPDAGKTATPIVEEVPVVEAVAEAVEQCQGHTKAGAQCKRKPTEGSAYCYAHQPE